MGRIEIGPLLWKKFGFENAFDSARYISALGAQIHVRVRSWKLWNPMICP